MGSYYSSLPLQTQGGPEHPIYVPSQTPIYIPSLSSAPTQVDSLSPTAPALGNNRTPSPTSQTSLVTDVVSINSVLPAIEEVNKAAEVLKRSPPPPVEPPVKKS